jgi:hypothetical protein
MKTLRMTLTREGCLGSCSDYTVDVQGDGAVLFTGRFFVRRPGNHRSHISPGAVAELLAQFRRADFFSLRDSYDAGVLDFPQYTVSIEFDGHKKSVSDSVGPWAGMPDAVTDLEKAIDRLAATGQWVRRPAR